MTCVWLELELVSSPDYLVFSVLWEKKHMDSSVYMWGSSYSEGKFLCDTTVL